MDSLIAAENSSSSDSRSASGGAGVAWLPDDPVGWIEREFFIPETGAAIVLEPYQREVLRHALERDDDGNFTHSLVLWSDIKKSAKSTIAGAVVLWLAWHHEWETCRVVANDLRQANSRTFYYIERAIKLNKHLNDVCKLKTYHIDLPNHTTIDAIPVDPKGEAGGGDLIVCFTELWAAKNQAAQQLWSETTLSPLKFGKSLRWCESYAGFEGESPILEQLYEAGVKNGALVAVELNDGKPALELYENPNGRLLCLWNTIPRCAWQTDAYYAQEESVLTPNEFDRLHGNIWATSTDAFVPPEWWGMCKGEFPDFGRAPLVAALDAAVSDDCFAIVAGHLIGDILFPRVTRTWTPPKGGKILYSNPLDPDDESTPEGFLRRLKRDYHFVYATYDAYQLHDFATRMETMLEVAFNPFSQGTDRLIADKMLYDAIRDKRITHDGNADLSEHITNANRKETGEADKLRIVKRTHERKIDAAVCLSMLNFVCREELIL